jgi:hypothetical protein
VICSRVQSEVPVLANPHIEPEPGEGHPQPLPVPALKAPGGLGLSLLSLAPDLGAHGLVGAGLLDPALQVHDALEQALGQGLLREFVLVQLQDVLAPLDRVQQHLGRHVHQGRQLLGLGSVRGLPLVRVDVELQPLLLVLDVLLVQLEGHWDRKQREVVQAGPDVCLPLQQPAVPAV